MEMACAQKNGYYYFSNHDGALLEIAIATLDGCHPKRGNEGISGFAGREAFFGLMRGVSHFCVAKWKTHLCAAGSGKINTRIAKEKKALPSNCL